MLFSFAHYQTIFSDFYHLSKNKDIIADIFNQVNLWIIQEIADQ
jgi:hypothetical protein